MNVTLNDESPHIDAAGEAAADPLSHTPAPGDMSMIAASTAAHEVNEMTNVTGAVMEIEEVNDAAAAKEFSPSASSSPTPSAAYQSHHVSVSVTAASVADSPPPIMMAPFDAGESNDRNEDGHHHHHHHQGGGEDESDDADGDGGADGESSRPHRKRQKRSHIDVNVDHHHDANDDHDRSDASSSASSLPSAVSLGDSALPTPMTMTIISGSDDLIHHRQNHHHHHHHHQDEDQPEMTGKMKRGSKEQNGQNRCATHTDANGNETKSDTIEPPPSPNSSTLADLPIARRTILNGGRGVTTSGVCNFDMLATDEVRSVMQMLDRSSILRLARCSKRMMSDADSDGAWRYVAPYKVVLDDRVDLLTHSIGVAISSSRLLSHLNTSVHLDCDFYDYRRDVCIDLLVDIPRVTKLITQGPIDEEQWQRLIESRAIRELTELTVESWDTESPLPRGFISHLARLTHLTRIDIRDHFTPGEDLSALSHLPLLSTLWFDDISWLPEGDLCYCGNSLAPSLVECHSITELGIYDLNAHGTQFRSTFTSPHLASTLKNLFIFGFFAGDPPDEYPDDGEYSDEEEDDPEYRYNQYEVDEYEYEAYRGEGYRKVERTRVTPDDYIASFQALTRLETLTLRAITDIHLILPCVPYLTSLIQLRLMDDDHRCSPDALRRLLLLPVVESDADSEDHHSSIRSSQADANAHAADLSVDQSRVNHRFTVFMQVYLVWRARDPHLLAIERDTTRLTIKWCGAD